MPVPMPPVQDETLDPQTASIGQLASMPPEQAGQLGGPGVDTPQEKQAVELLMQGAQLLRQAANVDPSVRPIIDKALQDAFLQITEHYGFGEEGKVALKQAQLMKNRAQAMKVSGAPGPTGPPPPPPMSA